MSEQVIIEVTDKVNANVSKKIKEIATVARDAHKNVESLKDSLARLNADAIGSLSKQIKANENSLKSQLAAINDNTSAINKNMLAQQRLSTEQARTATQTAKTAVETQRLATEQNKSATAAAKTAVETQRLTNAQTAGANSAAKLATEQARTAKELSNAEAAASRAALAKKRLDDAQKSATGSALTMANALKAIVASAAVMQYVKMSDAMTNLESRLKIVTNSTAELVNAQTRLYQIAQDSRNSYTELGTLYERLARSAKGTGTSTNELLNITNTISKAMIISGGSAESMNAALVQLSQGLASGVLRGEEFNSISEQTPRLALAIAEGLGVTTGALREMSKEGKLTTQVVLDALAKSAPKIAEEFKKMTPTIGGALTTVTNAITNLVGEFNKATGASAGIATGILTVGKALDGLAGILKSNQDSFNILLSGLGGAATAAALMAVAAGLKAVSVGLWAIAAPLIANPVILAILGIGAVVGGGLAIRQALDKTETGIRRTTEALIIQKTQIEKNLATGKLDDQQREQNLASLAKVNERLKEQQTQMATLNGEYANSAFRQQEIAQMNEQEATSIQKKKDAQEKYKNLIGELDGVTESYKKKVQELEALKPYISAEKYAVGLAKLKEEYNKITGATAANNKILNEQKAAYDKLSNSTEDRLAQLQFETSVSSDLSETQKYVAKTLQDLSQESRKLTAEQIKKIKSDLKQISVLGKKANAIQKEREALEELRNIQREINEDNAQRSRNDLEALRNSDLRKEAAQDDLAILQKEISLFGQTEKNKNIELGLFKEELRLKRELEAIDRRTDINGSAKQILKDDAETISKINKESLKFSESLREQTRILDSVDSAARDVFINVFENGSSAFKRLGNTLKTAVLDLLYQMTVRKWILNIGVSFLGGNSSLAGIVGGGDGSAFGALNNLSTAHGLYTAATGYSSNIATLSGLMGGGSSVGANAVQLGYANAVQAAGGDGLGALLGSTSNWGGVAVGSGAAGGAIAAGAGTFGSLGTGTAALGYGGTVLGTTGTLGTGTALLGSAAPATLTGLGATGAGLGTAGGIAASGAPASSALGAMGPYGWISLAVIAALAMFTGKGEKRSGGQYGYNADGTDIYNARRDETITGIKGELNFLEGPSGGQFAKDTVNKLVKENISGTNNLLKDLGSDSYIQLFNVGLETSSKGRGFAYAGGKLSTGEQFGEMGANIKGKSYSPEEAVNALALELSKSTLLALKAATDIPKTISEYLADKDIANMTKEQVAEVYTALNQQIAVLKQFKMTIEAMPFDSLNKASLKVTDDLIRLAGGTENLSTALNGYYNALFTADEKAEVSLKNMQLAFERLGLTMPTLSEGSESAIKQFKALVESQKLTTAEGQAQYLALLQLAPAFKELTDTLDQTGTTVKNTAEILRERDSLERQLLQLQGNTAEIRRRDLLLIDESNRAIQEQIWALEDAKKAEEDRTAAIKLSQDKAYNQLQSAIAAEKQVLSDRAATINESVSLLNTLFDTLHSNVVDLYGMTTATNAMQVAQANRVINTAYASGKVADPARFGEAIGIAKGALDPSNFRTQEDLDVERLSLAAKLSDLEKKTGIQLTTEERQLESINTQIKQLDSTLEYWKKQIDIASGTYEATLSVAEAVRIMAGLIQKPGSGTTGGTPNFVIGGGDGNRATFGGASGSQSSNNVTSKYNQVTSYGTSVGYKPITDQSQINRLDQLWPIYTSFDGTGDVAGLLNATKAAGFTMGDLSAISGFFRSDWERAAKNVGIAPFKNGGFHSGGAFIANEVGPELMYSAGQTRIHDAASTSVMIDNGSNGFAMLANMIAAMVNAQNLSNLHLGSMAENIDAMEEDTQAMNNILTGSAQGNIQLSTTNS